MSRRPVIVLLIAVLFASLPAAAQPQPVRLALLIANQGYSREVGPLANPHTDIEIVGAALRSIGFETAAPVKDARRAQILTAVRQFSARLAAAGPGAIGFVYYSGHGAAETDNATNYLIPIDAPDPGSPSFWDEALKLDDILRLLQGAREASKFVVFDACRNELATPDKGASKGFVPMAEQAGMFIAYATAAGRTASDRGSRGGPYSNALAREIVKSGVHHLDLFQNVKEAVTIATGGSQHPWESNGLPRRIYLAGAAAAAAPSAAPTPSASLPATLATPRLSEAGEAWTMVRETRDAAELVAFVRRYGDTFYGDLARSRLAAVQKEAEGRQAAERDQAQADKKSALLGSISKELERIQCLESPPRGGIGVEALGVAVRKGITAHNDAIGAQGKDARERLDVEEPGEATLIALRARSAPYCRNICEADRNGRCVARANAPPAKEPQRARQPAQAATAGRCDKWRSCVRMLSTRDTYNIYSNAAVDACGRPPTGCTR